MVFLVQLYSLNQIAREKGIEEVFRVVSQAGFNSVEFAGFYGLSPKQVKELLEKYGLKAVSAHILPNELEDCLPFIDELGIKFVFTPGETIDNYIDANKYALVLERMRKGVKLLKNRKIPFGYHNHAHEYTDGKDFIKKLLDDVPELKLELDVFWATVAGKNAVDEIRRFKDRLTFLHIKEAAKDNPVENAEPIVGEGAVGMDKVFALAKEQKIEYAVLEVEKVDGSMEDYLKKSLINMKKFSK